MERLWLGELTTEELTEMLTSSPTAALIPVGSTEPHGPHLPLATDAILSEEVCLRAARALRERGIHAVVAPPIAYGVTRYARGFRGALSLREETLEALLWDVIGALLDDGFSHVTLVNNHLEPEHAAALRRVIERVADERGDDVVSFPDQLTRRWGRTLTEEFKRGDCHAGRYETSLVQAARPGLVRPVAARLPSLGISLAEAIRTAGGSPVTFTEIGMSRAYTGAPAEATAAEGESIYERLVAMVVTEICERLLSPAPRENP
ncbi:MAG: creatininase family protein [Myxococcales bacterium]|nr:creatininase family protein [Polyangiaceae bacterium]MDW8247918.1 creatininase family protein [Myxococcales bacterium]